MFAAQNDPVDQVIDVGQMINHLARAEHTELAAMDRPKQLEKSHIARTIDAGRSDDACGQPLPNRVLHHQFAFEFRLLIDVTRIVGRLLD